MSQKTFLASRVMQWMIPSGRPLRVLLINALVTLSITLTVIGGLGITRLAEREIGAQANQLLTAMAADMRDKLDMGMAERFRDIKAVARWDDELAPKAAVKSRRIIYDRLSQVHPEYSWIGFADLQGRVLASSNGVLTGADVSARPWFSNAMKGFSVGDVHTANLLQSVLGKAGGEPLRFVDVAFPVRNGKGETLGVLGAHVSWTWAEDLSRRVLEVNGGGRVDILVVSREGQVLLGPKDMLDRSLPLSDLRGQNAAHDGSRVATWPDGKRYLTAYSETQGLGDYPGLGWLVLARQDTDVAFAAIDRLRAGVVGLGVLFVAVSILLGVFLAHALTRPIERMTDAAIRIQQGERNVDFPDTAGGREVAQLSGALRSMVGELSAQESALRAANDTLEKRIADATAALEIERARLENALEGSNLALWDCNLADRTVILSGHWNLMIGSDRHDTVVTTLEELAARVPPEELEAVRTAQKAAVSGPEGRYDVEHRLRRDDGQIFWIRSRGKVTARGPDGCATRLTGTIADITSRKFAELALREQSSKLGLILENMPLMVNFLDRECRFLFVNRRYYEFFGLTEQQVLGKTLAEVAGPEVQANAVQNLLRLERGEIVAYSRDRIDRQGLQRYFEIRQVPYISAQGRLEGFFSFIEDVTARRQSEHALMESEAQVRNMLDHVPAMICYTGFDCRHRFANKAFLDYFGQSETTVIGRTVAELAGEEGQRVLQLHLPEVRAGRPVVYERSRRLDNGRVASLEIRLIPYRAASGDVDGFYAMMIDVSARKEAEEAIRRQAQTDPLTGLFNKRVLIDRLEHALATVRRTGGGVAILFIDLDGFKLVNDQHGHAAGDMLLKEAAVRIGHTVRETDTLARVGGDEFVLLMENCDSFAVAAKVAEKILDSLQKPFPVTGAMAAVSCSIGISLFPQDGDTADVLLQKADIAMYAAKQAGKNRMSSGVGIKRPG